MCKISVVIPTYNRSDLLKKTLIALCHQTLTKDMFEVIVVDDGGSNNARSICDSFIGNLNIRYFWQSDNGFRAGKARNVGISAAEGEYILFIDTGVLLHQKTLARHLALHSRSNYPLVCIGYVYGFEVADEIMNEVISKITPNNVEGSIEVLVRESALDIRQKQYDEFGYSICTWPAPFDIFWTCHVSAEKKELIKVGMFDENFNSWGGEDVDLGVRLYLANNKFLVSTELSSIHWPHKKEVCDHKAQTENAAIRIHKKYNLWQTAFYNIDLNDEKYSLNKVIYTISAQGENDHAIV